LLLQPRKNTTALQRCEHGGINYAELAAPGFEPDSLLDFSVSTNPFMPPPVVREIAASARFERYPDSSSTLLRRKLAEKLGIMPENIVAGSGTTELIRLLAPAYFRRTDTVLIIGPTYGEYEAACRYADIHTVKYLAAEQTGFSPDMDTVTNIIAKKRPRALFLCNPNNPTGKYLPRRDILKIVETLKDGLLILDEAYMPFVEHRWDSLDLIKKENVILLRSMTKDYGIPGLRLGYALARIEIASILRSILPPWNINTIAQEVGTALLTDDANLMESLVKTREASRFLTRELEQLGFRILPSDTHYFLVKVGSAKEYRRGLLQKGILVRDCTSFGLAEYIRLSTRPIPECRRLVAAMEEILQHKDGAV
jgi:histidinol-phosphate aminotransferase